MGRFLDRHQDALARSLPFALYMAFLIAGPQIRAVLPSGVDPRWAYALRVGAVSVALALLWRRYPEFRGPLPSAPQWFLGGAVGILVFLLWILLDFPPLTLGEAPGFDPRVGGRVDPSLALTRLAGGMLVVPVMEELFWRSFLLRWLAHPSFLEVAPRSVGWKPILVSAALFATEHHLWFAGLLAGVAYGWLYQRTGTLWVPVLAHAVTNGVLALWILATGSWQLW